MKRALLIGVNYYSYNEEIVQALERQGYRTDYRPIERTAFLDMAAKKLWPRQFARRLETHHHKLIEESAREHYDVVLFIQCHQMTPENLGRLKAAHPKARFVLYYWDSLITHDYRPWLRFFDHVLTFDPQDAAAIGGAYLPLFAVPAYFQVRRDRPKDYDLYFAGAIVTVHRFEAMKTLYHFCKDRSIRLKLFLHCSLWRRWLLFRDRRYLPGMSVRSLDVHGIIDLMERSQAVFDFANHRQQGYTMRFIENLCAGQKIVTDNARVLAEPFYSSARFLVIHDMDLSKLPAFLTAPAPEPEDFSVYSIDSWAAKLLSAPPLTG